LPFQLLDPLFRSLQLPLQGHDQFDQPTDADFPRLNIFLELLNIHATLIADFPKSDRQQNLWVKMGLVSSVEVRFLRHDRANE
jgi:hypothetical protein